MKISKVSADPLFIVIDLFCGAGGVTTGFALAEEGIAKIIACINHDHNAILSHWANHPEVKHFEEDIRKVHLKDLIDVVNYWRKIYPNAKVILWASLECTEYSKAKGGLAREADSRTLWQSLYMRWSESKKDYVKRPSYIQLINPDYVMIENVVEFKIAGPMRKMYKNGKVVKVKNKHGEFVDGYELIPERKGEYFKKFCDEVDKIGYCNEWKEMNSADYGAYTSRNRLFGMFARTKESLIWPEPTHAKGGKNGLLKWRAVKHKLDFTDEGYSIFYRGRNTEIPKRQRKDLVNATLERLYAGCIKHIAGGKEAFLTKYHGTKPGGQPRTHSVDNPLAAIDTQNRFTVVQTQPAFIVQRNSGDPDSKIVDVNGPARVLTSTGGNQDLVQAKGFISMYHGNGDNTTSMENPCPVIPAADISAIVQTKEFIDNQYGSGYSSDINNPVGVLPANPKANLVQTTMFVDRQYGQGGGKSSSVEEPIGALPTVPKDNVIKTKSFVDTGNYTNVPRSIEEPLSPIMANRKWAYLLNMQYGGSIKSVDDPCRTIVAQAGKQPEYLIITESGEAKIAIYKTDSEIVRKLKEFMALYGIVDIKMRMLRVDELLRIQGFPDTYRLLGSQEDQKKFIGNSVVPDVVKSWAEAMADSIEYFTKQKIA